MDRVFLRRAFYRLIHALHDTAGNRITEYDYDESLGTSTLIREYIWADGMVVAVVEAGQMYFVRTDHIGRPVFATDTLGTKAWEASYLPFGGVQTSTGANSDLRFPGQWFQAETALHQNWMRDYDPTTGRYIQADPLGLVDGASVYGYALQNPGRYTDPTGEFIPVATAVGGAVLGYLLNRAADYVENEYCECGDSWNSDVLSAMSGASAADGSAMAVGKRFVTPGSSPGSSLQSTYLSRLLPQRMGTSVYTPNPRRWPWPKTNVAGRAIGRWLPVAAYGLVGYDLYRIFRCFGNG